MNYIYHRIYGQHRIPIHFIEDYLYKIYLGLLHSIAQLDEEFLSEYLEEKFAEKLISRLKYLKEEGYKVSSFWACVVGGSLTLV